MKPRLLDLFCGAGGCTKGYQRAGFYVVGVDLHPQPRYCGDRFVQDGALEALDHLLCGGTFLFGHDGALGLEDFAAIHASPPCQHYSVVTPTENRALHPDLIEATRTLLERTGHPYVIENVPGARRWLHEPAMLCGSSLGLDVQRHRLFETNWALSVPPCQHGWQTPRFPTQHSKRGTYLARVVHVNGDSPTSKGGSFEVWQRAMGVDWMTRGELVESIPPAMTELIGHQLLQHIERRPRAGEAVPPTLEKAS